MTARLKDKVVAPPFALADAEICDPPPGAGQATVSKGTAGQVQVTVTQGNTVLWKFLAVRPAASSGTEGSGVELRYVDYRGKRSLAHNRIIIIDILGQKHRGRSR